MKPKSLIMSVFMQNHSLLCSVAFGGISLLTTNIVFCPKASAATLYEADNYTNTLNQIDTLTGTVTPFPTTGTPLNSPFSLTFDGNRTLYEATGNNTLNRIDTLTGTVTPFPTNGTPLDYAFSLAFSANGILYEGTSINTLNRIDTLTGAVTPFLTNGAPINSPFSLTFDGNHTLYEGTDINTLNQIDTLTGTVTIFPTNGIPLQGPYGLAFAPATSTAVPEPLTIMGTLIGSTVAFFTRKKLKASSTHQ